MLGQLPDDSAFVASLRATPRGADVEDDDGEPVSPLIEELRAKRRHRGWGTDRELLARIGDGMTGHRYQRPGDDQEAGPVTSGGRRVVDFDGLNAMGF